ncbi:MAG: dihydroorotate dehydrogenase electron transfer subunit [Armatimonadota bacterium]|nr:dihydroorotate dehydrogenase electron transfer subunit [Armatimonadota bacterium]
MAEQFAHHSSNKEEADIPEGKLFECRIIDQEMVLPHIRRLVLDAPELSQKCVPGQFVHVLCNKFRQFYDPLLRRPFSIHFADPEAGHVSILFDIRGRGTKMLADKTIGDMIDLIGPLGHGFAIPDSWSGSFLLVGGGMGIAPLYFLLRALEKQFGKEKIKFLLGARTSNMILYREEFEKCCAEYLVSTEDGSYGYQGMVTDLLKERIETLDNKLGCLVYACGPMQMLKEVAKICHHHNLNCQISVETKMACGVGACMSCVIKVHDTNLEYRYARACVEGPVFDSNKIKWE